jgi:hypothetical protein
MEAIHSSDTLMVQKPQNKVINRSTTTMKTWKLKPKLLLFWILYMLSVRPGRDTDPSRPSSAEVWKQNSAIPLFSLRTFVACENGWNLRIFCQFSDVFTLQSTRFHNMFTE